MSPLAPPQQIEWQRFVGGWHAAFAMVATITGALVFGATDMTIQLQLNALILLALLCLWYAATGSEAISSAPGRLGITYLAVCVPLLVLLFALTHAALLMLFVIYPHVWMLLPLRRAAISSVATIGVIAVVLSLKAGLEPRTVIVAAVITLGCLLFALRLGTWISRIIRQSEERAFMLAALESTRAELATVSHDSGVLAERERLAREIHDTLAQGFTSMVMMLQAMEPEITEDPEAALRRREQLEQVARDNLAEARSLVALLTPTHLDATSLTEAVQRLVEQVGRELGIAATMSVTGAPRTLPTNHDVVLLRGTQEALANVRKHSGASAVSVDLGFHQDRVTLEVCDDGKGFDGSEQAGFGLSGMRARVTQVGGTMQVAAPLGRGVALLIDLPTEGEDARRECAAAAGR